MKAPWLETEKVGGRAVAAAAALLVLLGGCGGDRGPERPNVILVTLDTVRADHLSCNGYARSTSPYLDELAARGHLFENCRAASSWTVPSMASIFTSRYPGVHGVQNGIIDDDRVLNQELLEERFGTLAEALQAEGYTTFGVSSNLHVSRESGMGQGFDRFVSLGFVDAAMVHATVLGLKQDLRESEPFFLWVHYFDPHAPYRARFPAIREYGTDMGLAREWEHREVHTRASHLRENREILATLIDLYDSELHHTDSFLRRLFEEVVPGENNLAVVVADHGEAFLEHGFVAHGMSLFEEELHVPLIIVTPDGLGHGQRVASPVSALDIFPTVLDYVGAELPAGLDGVSLRRHLRGDPAREVRPVVSELAIDRRVPMRSIALGRWKYIERRTDEGMERDLFDLAADPEETRNLVHDRGDVARRLHAELERLLGPWPRGKTARRELPLTPAERKKLEALGYVGCAGRATAPLGSLPPPNHW